MKRSTFCIVLLLIISSIKCQQCPRRCKCSARVTVCTFFTGTNTMPPNLPSQMTALSNTSSYNKPNSIGVISSAMFPYPKMLHMILSYSGVTLIQDGTFRVLKELKTLNLAFNRISHLTQKTFNGLIKLNKLDLNGNENCKISQGTFDKLTSLQDLSLAKMNLQTFDVNLIKPLSKLVVLDLHGNSLPTIYWSVFKSFTNLKRLDLSVNQLTTMPSAMSTVIDKLLRINLAQNPWLCNWKLKWLRNRKIKAIFNAEASHENVVCGSPADLQFMALMNVPDPKLDPVLPKVVRCDKNVTTVIEGSPVMISCIIRGDPFPAAALMNPKGHLNNLSTSAINGLNVRYVTLNIVNASSNDNGIWTLQVSSNFGEDYWYVQITVILSTTTIRTTTLKTTTMTPNRSTTPTSKTSRTTFSESTPSLSIATTTSTSFKTTERLNPQTTSTTTSMLAARFVTRTSPLDIVLEKTHLIMQFITGFLS